MKDYQNHNDSELASLLRDGDNVAFREIYQRYSKLLYLFAYKKLRNEDEAMDVVHDVFTWVLNNRKTFAVATSLSSYLYKSVLNKIFNIFKKQETIKRYIDQGDHFIDVDSTGTDYLIREKDIIQMIDQEIKMMPPRLREVYELMVST